MIRVLQVSDKLSVSNAIHGVSRLFSWWIPRFDKIRYEVSVCSLRKDDEAASYLEAKGIQVRCLNKSRFDPSTLAALVRLIKEKDINILHLHGYAAWTFGRFASLITGVPAVLHEHFVDPRMPKYQKIVDSIMVNVECRVFANAEAVKEFCIRERKIKPGSVSVLYNGVPLEEFGAPSNGDIKKLKRELRIDEDMQVVGTIARLDTQKGVEYFLRAIPRIRLACPNTCFLVVGDGPLKEQLQRLTRELGVESQVRFTGFRRDIPAILQVITVSVIASLWEGTTLTAFEAMASSTPLVSTAVDGIKEVLKDGENAILVPAADPDALARAIIRLLRNKDEAKRLVETASRCVRKYDLTRAVRSIEMTYESVLGRG